MMIEFSRLPTGDAACCGRGLPALLLILLSVFYMPAGIDIDRYRVGGVAGRRQPRRRACCSSFRSRAYRMLGLFDLVFLVPELLLLLVAVNGAAGCGGGETARRRGPDAPSSAATGVAWSFGAARGRAARRRRSSSTSASSARSRRPTSRPTKTTSCSARSAPKSSRAFRTGSGWCCRASFPDLLPGARRLRLARHPVAQDGHEMPIGFSKVTVGFPRVGINCAVCHTASFRARPDDAADASSPAGAVAPDRRRSSTSASCSRAPPIRASTPTRCSPRSPGTPGCR